MKFSLSLLLAGACFLPALGQPATDLQNGNLKGKVKSFSESHYSARAANGKFELGEKDPMMNTRHQFNTSGNMTESHVLDADGNPMSTLSFTYTPEGARKEVANTMYGELNNRTTYVLDGLKVKEARTYNPTGELQYRMEFDYTGNLQTGGRAMLKTDEVSYRFSKAYTGNLLSEDLMKDAAGKTVMATYYQRDQNGDVIVQETLAQGADKKNTTRFRYEYDRHKNWVKQYHLNQAGNAEKIVVREFTYYSK